MQLSKENTRYVPIPMLRDQDYDLLFDPGTSLTKLDFSEVEINEAFSYSQVLLMLYHVGATLINSGKAYQADISPQGSKLKAVPYSHHLDPRHEAHRNVLSAYYYGLPGQAPGENFSKDPYHAIFVLKVAFDHMPQELRSSLFARFIDSGRAIRGEPIEFPNHSTFQSSSVVRALFLASMAPDHISTTLAPTLRAGIGIPDVQVFEQVIRTFAQQIIGPFLSHNEVVASHMIGTILAPINAYGAAKTRFFSHNNVARANQLCTKLLQLKTYAEVSYELRREREFFEPTMLLSYCQKEEDKQFREKATTYKAQDKCGYRSALDQALVVLTAYHTAAYSIMMEELPPTENTAQP